VHVFLRKHTQALFPEHCGTPGRVGIAETRATAIQKRLMDDWDDIRFFLAVARAGSLSAAARALRTSQPTVGRRIDALEARLNAKLFDRHRAGLGLTEAGRSIWEVANQMETAALAVQRHVQGEDGKLQGSVRISVTEGMGAIWLTPHLMRFQRENPAITVEIVSDNAVVDLARGGADIALRLARPHQPDLVARRVGYLTLRLYAAPSYTSVFGVPRTLDELFEHKLVDFSWIYASTRANRWRELASKHANIAYRSNSSLAQLNAVICGFGIGLLPSYVEDLYPSLVPIVPHVAWPQQEIWLVSHADMRRNARVRCALDYLGDLFSSEKARFRRSGEAGAMVIPLAAARRSGGGRRD
jgi:DNA-binding transcriptional LysR family regulator